jgi:protein TonB
VAAEIVQRPREKAVMRSVPLLAALLVHAVAFGIAVRAGGTPPQPLAEPAFAISFAWRPSAPAEPAAAPRVPGPSLPELAPAPAAHLEPVRPSAAHAPPPAAPQPAPRASWLETGSRPAAAPPAPAPPLPAPVVPAPPPAAAAGAGTPAAAAEPSARVEAEAIDPANAPPEYPLRARRLGHEGTVVVELSIDVDGRVAAAAVSRSSGSHLLDRAALAALRAWRYRPAREGGQPVATRVLVRVVYQLRDGVRTS